MWVRDVSLDAGRGRLALLRHLRCSRSTTRAARTSGSPSSSTTSRPRVTSSDELEFANRQLETAYEELQSTNEELETTNEELQSTVEELETTNEELQSTNEELETMNEELQSMNDELHMLGETQREQQEHFYQLNQFMVSVLGSIDSGIVVVDQDVRVLAWNAKATDLWGIRADEAQGELFVHLDIGLPLETVRPALESQLSGAPTAPAALSVSGVNRRGRDVQVQVRVTRLAQDGAQPPGALLVMDVVPQA